MDSIFIILLISFIGAFLFGIFIIYKQVALVRKGEFRFKDRIYIIFYGFIFGFAVLVVVGMAFIIAIESPDFWTDMSPPEFQSEYFLIPFVICLVYISFYPAIDFLFIAISDPSDEGLTPFHKFLGVKILNKINNRNLNIIIAFVLYIILFILPPVTITLLLDIPLIVIWITWILIYPLLIIIFYGARGYIAGISNAFYHIPDIKRLIFYGYEDGQKKRVGIGEGLGPRIGIGLMLFVFVWSWISLFQTINFYFTKSLAIALALSSVFIFVTLFFGILGYFTRFWGRKTTYRGIDIYFSAYLIAAIGINVLINALLINYDKLEVAFNLWEFSREIIPNYYMFAFAAVIEEILVISFILYYFLSRKNNYKDQLKFSKIVECGQTFDPFPLFNFLKSRDIKIRTRAKITLQMMYKNIPVKEDIDINSFKYKYPVLEGIRDPNAYTREISLKILIGLEKQIPEKILPWIIDAFEYSDVDKIIPISESILSSNINLVKEIPYNYIIDLVKSSEWRIKLVGLRFLSEIIKYDNELLSEFNLSELLKHPNPNIQAEAMKILGIDKYNLNQDIILLKLKSSKPIIQAGMINYLSNFKEIRSMVMIELIKLASDPQCKVRVELLDFLNNIGDFNKNSIPINLFLEGLIDLNKNIRDSSVKALDAHAKESLDWYQVYANFIMDRIDNNTNLEVLRSTVSLLNKLWRYNPEPVMKCFVHLMKLQNTVLNKYISGILILKCDKNLEIVIRNLTDIPDVSRIVAKGFLTKTITSITRDHPVEFIPQLTEALIPKGEDETFDWIPTLKKLSDNYPQLNNVITLLSEIGEDEMDASYFGIQKLYIQDPEAFKSRIHRALKDFPNQITSIKIKTSKTFLKIAKKSPSVLPVKHISEFLRDPIKQIREIGAEILGMIGHKNPERSIADLFVFGLNDDSWMVKEISLSSISSIIFKSSNKSKLIENLVPHLSDTNPWIRIAASQIITEFKTIETNIPIEYVINNIYHEDPKVREASSSLLSIFAYKDLDYIFKHILSLLGDDSVYVRNKIIEDFTEIINDIGLNNILSQLLKNLSDESSLNQQRSIALVLENVSINQAKDIRNRIISLLKIRCEMSQDPTICGVFHRMKES